MTGVVHIAGSDITVGTRMRQRCAWCGALLLDYDLSRMAVPVGVDPRPPKWTAGNLVCVDGNLQDEVAHVDGEALPPAACAVLDPEITR